jgi:hypothetical protein
MEAIMKRTLIRSTVMLLAVLAVSVSIKAQSAQQYSANIPFSFEARGERYAAGKYRLGSMSVNTPGAIGLREMRSGHIRVLGITHGEGSRNWDNPGTLTFRKVNGRYLLSEISTATFQMKVRSKKNSIDELADVASAEQVVTIFLN